MLETVRFGRTNSHKARRTIEASALPRGINSTMEEALAAFAAVTDAAAAGAQLFHQFANGVLACR